MPNQNPWVISALVLACGQATSLRAQEGGTSPSTPAPTAPQATPPAPDAGTAAKPAGVDAAPPAAPAAGPAQPGGSAKVEPASPPVQPDKPISFNFQDAPYAQVMDFIARQSGLPVIKEAPLPDAPVTFISATSYSLEEAIDVLNRMLFMHGLQVRRDANFLLVTKIENMAPLGPVGQGRVPEGAGTTQIVTLVMPLQNAGAAPLSEQLKPLVTKVGGITPLPSQNSLVIVDTAAQCERLREIIKMLDAEPPSDAQYRIFALKNAKADTVFGALKGLLSEKRTMQIVEKDGSIRTVKDEQITGLSVQPYAATNSIIAIGPEGRLRTVEELVALLDRESSEDGDRVMMTFLLLAAAPDDAAARVTSLFAAVPPEKKPTILPIKDQGKLTVVGTSSQLALAANLIGEIDPGAAPSSAAPGQPRPAKPESRASLVRLKHTTPGAAQSILSRLLSPRQLAVLRYAPAPDEKGLIVSGPASDVEAFEQLLAGIDVPPQLDTEVRQVLISTGDPKAVLDRAVELFALASRSKTDPVTAKLEADSRTVTLVGSRLGLEAFSQSLSSAQTTAGILRETRSYDVVRVTPSVLAAKLVRLARPMLEPADGSAYLAPSIEPVDELKRVIVRATPEQFAVVEQLVKSIDVPDAGKRQFRIVSVPTGPAKELAEKALAVFRKQTEGLTPVPSLEVTPDDGARTLSVVADAEAMARFDVILAELQKQAAPVRELRLIELRNAPPADVISFLEDLIRSSKPFTAQSGPDPVFEPIDATNSIMVAAAPGQLAIISELVKSLDQRRAGERPPLRILKLRTTDAPGIAQILTQTYEARPAEQRQKFPVQITADSATNTLIVSAHPDAFTEIEGITKQLNETQSVDAAGREIRIFPLKVARSEELARTIDEMYPSPPMPRDRNGAPRPDLQKPKEVVVRADRGTNSLIVDAPSVRMAGFEQLVQQLDQAKLADNVELRTYRVLRADLSAVATTMRSTAANGGLTGGKPPAAGVSAAITVDIEPMSRSLIVSGPSEIFAPVEKLLASLDAAPMHASTGVKMYAMKHARAERLQPLLSKLLASRLKEQQIKDGTVAVPGDLQTMLDVASDPATNTLIISAPESIQQIAEQLIEALDTPAAQTGRAVIRVVPLTYADANQAAQTLNNALGTIELPSGGRVTVLPTAGSNALLLSGAEADLKKVEELVTTLDVRPVTPDAITVETFVLKHAEAGVIAPMVQGLLVEKQTSDPAILRMQMQYSRGQLPKIPQVKVEADARTNSLVVSGPTAVTQLAKAVIERLDQPAGETGRISRAFTPAKANPADLIRAVQPIVLATTPAGRKPIELISAPGAASVVVIGTEEQVGSALRTLAEFDDRTIATPVVEVQVVDLKHTDAGATGRAVQSMLAERSRWPESLRGAERAGLAVPVPTVNAEASSNRLIIAAPVDLMPVARQLIDVMDRPRAGSDTEVRVFPLKKSKAESVARAITTGFAATARPADPVPAVAAEPTSNSVVVSGTAARLAQAEGIVRQLDESAQPDGIAVRTIQLEHARAETVAPVVESLLAKKSMVELLPQWERSNYLRQQSEESSIRIAAEKRLNAIVVTGPIGIIEVAEQIVRELDTDQAADPASVRAVRIIPVTNADAASVAANIEAIFADDSSTLPPPTIRVDKDSNSLILRATPDQLAMIQSVVKELDEATYSSSREMRLVPIDRSKADAMIMAQTIQRVLQQRSGVQVEIISADDLIKGQGDTESDSDPTKPGSGGKPKKPAPKKDSRGSMRPGRGGAGLGWLASGPGPTGIVGAALGSMTLGLVASAADSPAASPWPDPFAMWRLAPRMFESTSADAAPTVTAGTIRLPLDPPEDDPPVAGPDAPAPPEDDAGPAADAEPQPAGSEPGKAINIRPRPARPNPASVLPGLSSRIGSGDDNKVTIAVDPRTNSLIVTSSPRLADRIAALATDLQNKMPAEPRKVRVITLPESADAGTLSNRLEATIRQIGQSSPNNPGGFTGRVTVQSDPAGGALIVSSNDTDFQAVSELIAALSRPGPSSSLTVKVYPLSSLTATSASRAITDLLSASPRGAQARRVREQELTIETPDGVTKGRIDPSEVRIVADPSGTAIIVAAPARALPVLDQFVAMLDQSPALERAAIREFALKNARAADAARTLQSAFDAIRRSATQRRGPEGGDRLPEAHFVADDRTGTLLVTGSDAQLKETERLLTTIDAPLEDDDTQVEIIALQLARPTAVREIVQTVLVGRDEGKKDRIRISASDETGLFVIRATPAQIEQARKIVSEVDKTVVTGLPIRSIKLERADAQQVATGLQKFFEDRARLSVRQGQRNAQARQVAIIGDRRTSTLVIAAADEDFEQIKSMISTFDAPATARDLQFRVIPLEKARVSELQNAIANMVDNLTYSPFIWWGGREQDDNKDKLVVEFNERANSVILMGQGESFDAAEKMIKALDEATPAGTAFVLRSVRVKNSDPTKIADAVQTALSTPGWRSWRGADPDGVRAIPDRAAGPILLVGRADRIAEAETLIAAL
ncbi:MAG: secretin N-terminal domain-containing protein, partial [Phycisphaerales bacterium]